MNVNPRELAELNLNDEDKALPDVSNYFGNSVRTFIAFLKLVKTQINARLYSTTKHEWYKFKDDGQGMENMEKWDMTKCKLVPLKFRPKKSKKRSSKKSKKSKKRSSKKSRK